MLGARVLVGRVTGPGSLEGGFVSRPGRVDAFVYRRKVDQQRRLDLGCIFRRRVVAIKGHGRRQIGQAHRERVCHTTAVTKPHRTEFAVALRQGLQPARRGHKVFAGFGLVQLGKQGACLVFVTGVTPQRCQGVGRQYQIPFQRQPAGNVFDVGVEAPVFVHHQNAGQLAIRLGGLGQVALDAAVTGGRGDIDHAGADACIVFGHHLAHGKVGAQSRQQAHGRGATHGKLLGLFQKTTPVHQTVHIGIKQDQQFLVEVLCGLALHGGLQKRRQLSPLCFRLY